MNGECARRAGKAALQDRESSNPRDRGPSGPALPLPPPRFRGAAALAEVVAARRSRREFARRALSAEELSALLWAGQGITSPDGRRAAPSAGALYPVMLAVADGRGVFRYRPADHALEQVLAGDRRPALAAAALGQACVAEAAACVVIAADPGRLRARYAGRSERYCLLEAGHVAQNLLLAATALGLSAVPVGAFDDEALHAAAGLEEGSQALYLVAVGAPARGT